MNIKILYGILFLMSLPISAQELLTKQEAVSIALDNNYGIKIADNDLKIAENNKSILNSGYLPTLSGNAGATYNLDNNTSVRIDTTLSLKRAESNRYNASVSLNYTLFDGMGRHYDYQRLKEQYNLSELQARQTIENTILQLFSVYYNVAKLTENYQLQQQSLAISKDRLQRVQYQFEYGQNTKLAVLNAEVDVNNDSINLLSTKQLLTNAKRDLYVVLGKDEAPEFTVDTLVNFTLAPNKEVLYEKVKTNNVVLQQLEKNITISEFQIKANRSGYLPTVGLNGTYGWNKNNNNGSSFIISSTNSGLSGGLSLSWNVFDGGRTKTLVNNAKINLETQQLLKEETELDITRTFNNAYDDYLNKLFILQTQEKNVQTNTNNFNRTEERFKLGQVTSIEFRQAQLNLVNAINAKNTAKYDAKLAELQVLQLSGDLLDTAY
ncbi:TolC family protein [Aureibaculum sp. 2210JD6-5]|uniref:TolC family protein n=1 Tax=Aureibaculum sp. 2210JD6-5 TaxID=3103957 RepID=UPI002AAC7753|nr:TolC family protein [Aureibaculum sp. 2210JD6-5]MDY7395629.1 TolC family protein [Aureibaculum sp. 2210JD6-5]